MVDPELRLRTVRTAGEYIYMSCSWAQLWIAEKGTAAARRRRREGRASSSTPVVRELASLGGRRQELQISL